MSSLVEIQSAYDEQYNKWRRLVNHHDPNVVNQANLALQSLQQLLATLTDSNRRAAYDAGIGLSGVGGLADPEAILRAPLPSVTPPPPPRQTAQPPPAPVAPSAPTLWACPKCNANNPEHTHYCFKCGTQLVRKCPECNGDTSLVATGFCGKCGFKYDVALRRKELQNVAGQLRKGASTIDAQITSVRARELNFTGVGVGVAIMMLTLLGLCGWARSIESALVVFACGGLGFLITGLSVGYILLVKSRKDTELHNLDYTFQEISARLAAAEQEYRKLGMTRG